MNLWIKKTYPQLTLSHLHKLCRTGQIRVNGKRITYNTILKENDEVRLPPFINEYKGDKLPLKSTHTNYTNNDIENILKSIIYEDDEIIVLNKQSGLATQGGSGITKHIDSLINMALPQYNNNLRLTHRIDKETSGILLIAKNYDSAVKYTNMFKDKKIKKTYLALVYGNFDDKEKSGTIKIPLPDEKDETKLKTAISLYKVKDEAYNMLSLVELSPLTGRKHQLRIHMQKLNHAILGDFKYSNDDSFKKIKEAFDINIERKLYLHAYQIEIEGKPKIIAPLPDYFEKICKYLNF